MIVLKIKSNHTSWNLWGFMQIMIRTRTRTTAAAAITTIMKTFSLSSSSCNSINDSNPLQLFVFPLVSSFVYMTGYFSKKLLHIWKFALTETTCRQFLSPLQTEVIIEKKLTLYEYCCMEYRKYDYSFSSSL